MTRTATTSERVLADRVIWHELECGRYTEDLPLWRSLAERHGGPVLDIGAGVGRVALDLAPRGHALTALDHDRGLLDELERRAAGMPVMTLCADARAFELPGAGFALCLVPMQTVQLLGGPDGRAGLLRSLRACLRPGGRAAVAIVEHVECYEERDGACGPLPDVLERDGTVYFSQPTAVRLTPRGFVLERRRERVDAHGGRTVEENAITLDRVTGGELEAEARAAGLRPAGRLVIPDSDDHVGSLVVMLDG